MGAQVLMAIVVGILKFLAQRADQKNAAQAEVYRELWKQADVARQWEVEAAGRPDGGAGLRVRPGAGTLKITSPTEPVSGPDAGPPGPTPGNPL